MNKDLEKRYRSVIQDNVNAGKTSDGKEFLILISGLFGICLLIYLFADSISNLFIDVMPQSTQNKIENALSGIAIGLNCNTDGLENINYIKNKIINTDARLYNKKYFPVCKHNSDEINAFIAPNGTIYLTKGILDEIKEEEMLAFVLSHEFGHYINRDHLRGFGREIIAASILSVISLGQKDISTTFKSASNITSNKYSRNQEKAADIFANNMLYALYNRNTGAVKVFELFDKKEKMPEFLYYFSTHPPAKERLKYIKNTIKS